MSYRNGITRTGLMFLLVLGMREKHEESHKGETNMWQDDFPEILSDNTQLSSLFLFILALQVYAVSITTAGFRVPVEVEVTAAVAAIFRTSRYAYLSFSETVSQCPSVLNLTLEDPSPTGLLFA